MPNVTPSGPLAVAVDALRTLIANVQYFQTWTGLNAAGALGRIFSGELGSKILSVAISSGVATIRTVEPHQINIGDSILIEGASLGAESGIYLDGPQTVVSVPSSTSFTLATALGDSAEVLPFKTTVLPARRPIVCVCEEDDPLHATSIGTNGTVAMSGAIEILIEADVSSSYVNDGQNALMEARNNFGQLFLGIAQLQGTADYILLNSITAISGPRFIDRIDQDDNAKRYERWQALIKVTWGLEG